MQIETEIIKSVPYIRATANMMDQREMNREAQVSRILASFYKHNPKFFLPQLKERGTTE